jgi:hypothetical protein
MTQRVAGKFGRLVLWFSPVIIVAVCFLATITWLKPTPGVVQVLSAAAGIFVLGYSLFLANRESRHWDEVQRASQGFASAKGWVWGGFATLLLLMMPPVMNGLVDVANVVGGQSVDVSRHSPVRVAFFFGVTLVMVMQALGIAVASRVWWRRMGGIGEKS